MEATNMDPETKALLKTGLGIVGLLGLWIDPAVFTWVLFAVLGSWILWVAVLSNLMAAQARKRS